MKVVRERKHLIMGAPINIPAKKTKVSRRVRNSKGIVGGFQSQT